MNYLLKTSEELINLKNTRKEMIWCFDFCLHNKNKEDAITISNRISTISHKITSLTHQIEFESYVN